VKNLAFSRLCTREKLLEEILSKLHKFLVDAFILYDTYGFLELTQEIAAEHGITVDLQAF